MGLSSNIQKPITSGTRFSSTGKLNSQHWTQAISSRLKLITTRTQDLTNTPEPTEEQDVPGESSAEQNKNLTTVGEYSPADRKESCADKARSETLAKEKIAQFIYTGH